MPFALRDKNSSTSSRCTCINCHLYGSKISYFKIIAHENLPNYSSLFFQRSYFSRFHLPKDCILFYLTGFMLSFFRGTFFFICCFFMYFFSLYCLSCFQFFVFIFFCFDLFYSNLFLLFAFFVLVFLAFRFFIFLFLFNLHRRSCINFLECPLHRPIIGESRLLSHLFYTHIRQI